MIRRYKRFLVDARLADDTRVTMHCANTGAMTGCIHPGHPIYYSISDNPNRKLSRSLELIQTPDRELVCVNTAQANRVVKEALANQTIEPLAGHEYRSEVAIPDESGRFDFGNEGTFIEVKSVTYKRGDVGVFPDAKSVRATKHVNALRRSLAQNKKAVLFFCVAHTGIDRVAIAGDIDPVYAMAVAKAIKAGVEVLAYGCEISTTGMRIMRQLPFEETS